MKMRFSTILSEKTIRRATLILTAAVLTTLTACRNNETHRTRLTNTEMDSYGKAIAGQYEGSYIILWSNSTGQHVEKHCFPQVPHPFAEQHH